VVEEGAVRTALTKDTRFPCDKVVASGEATTLRARSIGNRFPDVDFIENDGPTWATARPRQKASVCFVN
jgi:hypothetical protein